MLHDGVLQNGQSKAIIKRPLFIGIELIFIHNGYCNCSVVLSFKKLIYVRIKLASWVGDGLGALTMLTEAIL